MELHCCKVREEEELAIRPQVIMAMADLAEVISHFIFLNHKIFLN
jgi:hypothetical protein